MTIDIKGNTELQERCNYRQDIILELKRASLKNFSLEWQYEWKKGQRNLMPQCKITAVFTQICNRILNDFNMFKPEKLNLITELPCQTQRTSARHDVGWDAP